MLSVLHFHLPRLHFTSKRMLIQNGCPACPCHKEAKPRCMGGCQHPNPWPYLPRLTARDPTHSLLWLSLCILCLSNLTPSHDVRHPFLPPPCQGGSLHPNLSTGILWLPCLSQQLSINCQALLQAWVIILPKHCFFLRKTVGSEDRLLVKIPALPLCNYYFTPQGKLLDLSLPPFPHL